MSCQVAQCRHSESHITSYHKCGNCGAYGHGRVECPSKPKEAPLDKFFRVGPEPQNILNYGPLQALERLPTIPLDPRLHCTVPGCPVPSTHSAAAHHRDFDEYATLGGPDQYGILRRRTEGERAVRAAVEAQPGTCAWVYWGMGNFICARNRDGVIEESITDADMTDFCQGYRCINLDERIHHRGAQ